MATGGEESVGDLVVNMRGNSALDTSLQHTLDLLDAIADAGTRAQASVNGIRLPGGGTSTFTPPPPPGTSTTTAPTSANFQQQVVQNQLMLSQLIELNQAVRTGVTYLVRMEAYMALGGRGGGPSAGGSVRLRPMLNPGGGGGGDEEGGGHFSHYLAQRIGYHAGVALGMSNVGTDLSGVMAVVQAFGPAGLIVTGMVAVAAAAKDMTDRMEELRHQMRELRGEVEDQQRAFTAAAKLSALPHTGPGREFSSQGLGFAQQAAQGRRQQEEMFDELTRTPFSGASTKLGMWFEEQTKGRKNFFQGGDPEGTTFFKSQQAQADHSQYLEDQSKIFQEAQERAIETQRVRNSEDRKMAAESAQINAMYEGPAKQRAEVEHKIAEDRLKVQRDFEDRSDQFLAQNQAARRALLDKLVHDETKPMEEKQKEYQALLREQMGQRLDMLKEHSADVANVDKKAAADRAALQRDLDAQIRKDREQSEASGISSTTLGFNREMKLAQHHHDVMRQEYIRQGRDTRYLDIDFTNKKIEMERDRNREVQFMEEDLQHRLKVARREENPIDAEWARELRHLRDELGLSAQKIEEIKQKFYEMRQAEVDATHVIAIKGLNVELDVALRKITDLEAAYRRLKIANPFASDDLIRQEALMQRQVAAAQFIRHELSQFRPQLIFEDYARQIKEALLLGAVSMKDAILLLKRDAFNTVAHPIDPGTFNASFRAGYVDVSHINMNKPMNDLVIETKKNGDVLLKINTNLGQMISQILLPH